MLDVKKYICEVCQEDFDPRDSDQADDCDCIEENKRCRDCYDEWGEDWPDRV